MALCRQAMWAEHKYVSLNLPFVDDDGDDEDDMGSDGEESDVEDRRAIRYVVGDVTHPQVQEGDAIVVHCAGNLL